MLKFIILVFVGFWYPVAAQSQTVSGILEPKKDVIIKTSIDGIVSTVTLVEGSKVRSDDVIVSFDASEQTAKVSLAKTIANAKAAIGAARNNAAVAERKYHDLEKAMQNNAATDWEVLDAKANKSLAVYELSAAKEEAEANLYRLKIEEEILSRYQFKAPFGGILAEVFVTEGQSVSRGEKIAHLVNINELEIESFVDAKYSNLLVVGQPYAAQIDIPFDQTFPVTLSYISPIFDPATGTVRVVFKADNELNLPVGISTTISLESKPVHLTIQNQGD